MSLTVQRESDTTNARFVTPTFMSISGDQKVASVRDPAPVIEPAEQLLQDGKVFGFGVVKPFASKLASGASIDIGIAFSAGVTPVISFSGLSSGDAEGYLYENADLSGGTAGTAINLNRNSTTASQSAITVGPTVNNLGTLILGQILIGGSGKKAGGGDIGSSNLILKPLTSYLVRLTNVNGTDHAAEVILEWRE